jgi:SAM-dependent methyltransferase
MKYLEIANHYNKCYESHGDNHLGVDWPKYEETLIRHKIMYELINNTKYEDIINSTILDFGCGLGHFYEWILSTQKYHPKYSGLDINEPFYNHCKNKYINSDFYHKDILIDDNIPNFDYIVCNGVFTEKRELSQKEMMNFFNSTLIKLWDKTKKGISFNLMSKHVDWEREDLFHVSLDKLGWFLKENLSRNFIIRNDYKLFEYTVYVYKN